jgi:hypothetical protein
MKTRVSVEIVDSAFILSNWIKPRQTAIGRPLWMTAHASDWDSSLNAHSRGAKWLTMVVMFVGCLMFVLDDDPNIVYFYRRKPM